MLAGMGLDPSAHPAMRFFLATPYFWQGGTEQSRPFSTNQPKVCNYLVGFFDTQGGVIHLISIFFALILDENHSVRCNKHIQGEDAPFGYLRLFLYRRERRVAVYTGDYRTSG